MRLLLVFFALKGRNVLLLRLELLALRCDLVLKLFDLEEQLVPLLLLHDFVVFDLLVDLLAVLLPLLEGRPLRLDFLLQLLLFLSLLLDLLGQLRNLLGEPLSEQGRLVALRLRLRLLCLVR